VLTHGGHEDRDLLPFVHPYSRKRRAARALMGEAASHFAGLASRTSFWNNGEGAHLDILLFKFFMVNDPLNDILTSYSYLSSIFLLFLKKVVRPIGFCSV
jgi:hypothetical protein